MKRFPFAGVALVWSALCTVPSAGLAQAPSGDSAVGTGGDADFFMEIDAHSGPAGQNPTGTVQWQFGDLRRTTRVMGSVTCLRVSGDTAVVGFSGTATVDGIGVPAAGKVRIVDRGGLNSELDAVEWNAGYGAPGDPPLPAPTDCSSYIPVVGGDGSPLSPDGDFVVRDDGRAPPKRMVGKGSVPSLSAGGPTAAYVYILNCDPTPNPPFEVRFGTQRFRLTSVSSSGCRNLNGPIHEGSGSGTLSSGGPGVIEWGFADGGVGGMHDFAVITIKNAAGTTVFSGGAAPPGKFPGSTQATGNNTYQNVP